MFNQDQFQELLTRKHQEKKLNIHQLLPQELFNFNKWFWENYEGLRPVEMMGDKFNLETYRLRDSSEEGKRYHNSLRIVDHWITSDEAGYLLVEGIFIPGTKPRQVWFTLGSLIEMEAAKVVYYVMKNGLIYKDDLWWTVLNYIDAVATNPDMEMLEKQDSIPDSVTSY